jgi:hypothetical protein
MFSQLSHTRLVAPSRSPSSTSVHDQIQIALAIADETVLKSLLLSCTPPIAAAHTVGTVNARIGIPIPNGRAADGIIQYEAVQCVLTESQAEIEQRFSIWGDRDRRERRYAQLTRCESETHTLGQSLSLAQALAVLNQAGFDPSQVQTILNLPHDAYHKSWWYMLDATGEFSSPFRRMIRTLRYADGTFTLQYKDQFVQDKPSCFKSEMRSILVAIKSPRQSFGRTLEKINRNREVLGSSAALLICDEVSDLEAKGFISQGISVYSAHELLLPTRANCQVCVNAGCPLNGALQSPVRLCKQFCLDGQMN